MLPNAALAFIDERKITDYLLARGHPAGRAKARYFEQLGFTVTASTALRDALLDHALAAQVVAASDTPFGNKYVLDGSLAAPWRLRTAGHREFARSGLLNAARRRQNSSQPTRRREFVDDQGT